MNEQNNNDVIRYNKLNKFEQYSKSPFVNGNTLLPVKKKNIFIGEPEQILVNYNTGETTGKVIAKKFMDVDSDQFIKIYINEIKSLFSLRQNALKVLSYILSIIPINKDQIIFDIDECKTFTGYSAASTIFDGLSILVENGIIARSEKSYIYYINPIYFFNGDRLILVREYNRKTKKVKSNSINNHELFEGD